MMGPAPAVPHLFDSDGRTDGRGPVAAVMWTVDRPLQSLDSLDANSQGWHRLVAKPGFDEGAGELGAALLARPERQGRRWV